MCAETRLAALPQLRNLPQGAAACPTSAERLVGACQHALVQGLNVSTEPDGLPLAWPFDSRLHVDGARTYGAGTYSKAPMSERAPCGLGVPSKS